MADALEHCAYHSEIVAIKQAGDVRGAIVYNARVNRNGERRLSKPCDNCQKTLDASGVKRVVWTNNLDERIYYEY